MNDILKFKILNQLKTIKRDNSVENRKESSAEHSWSCLMLADYLIEKYNYDFNKTKVYEILMYHDVVEIEADDVALFKSHEINDKKEKEELGAKKLRTELPDPINNKFYELFSEFEEQKTIESKFAKAIDALDAVIQEIDYKEDWKGWTKKFLVSKKEKYFQDFPELKEEFYKLIEYLEKEGYFNQ